jgi:hypothetical protein
MELYESMNHYDSDNTQVHEAVKDNLIATFALNYLDDLDKDIEEPCLKVMRLQGRVLRYWLDGASRMSPECYRDLAAILRVPLSTEEEQLMNSMHVLDQYGGTSFFQSALRQPEMQNLQNSADLLANQGYMDGAPPGEQDFRQLSFAELHPELGLSALEYEELTKRSMLKGSVGVYIKVCMYYDRIHHTIPSTWRTK